MSICTTDLLTYMRISFLRGCLGERDPSHTWLQVYAFLVTVADFCNEC